MNLQESRDKIEFRKAWAEFNAKEHRIIKQKIKEKGIYIDGDCDIIKEWYESLHPRDENGRFTNAGGLTSPLVDGPVESKAYIDKYFSEHSDVAEEASQYKDVLSNVQNFAANHPNAAEGTYDAVTGEAIDTKDLNGLCVTFHQNLSMTDPYGAYTAEDYAALCAIAKNELGAKSVNIGYFGGAAEVSFVCESQKAAVDFAIAHNQHSVYDPTEGEYGDAIVNAYYNPETNPIEGH